MINSQKKELLSKRREGTAPWALGEGSAELSSVQPWYSRRNIQANETVIRGEVATGEAVLVRKLYDFCGHLLCFIASVAVEYACLNE